MPFGHNTAGLSDAENKSLADAFYSIQKGEKMNPVTNFDATNIPPQQMGDRHPVGMFPFQISKTYGKQNNNTPGGQFVVELTSPAGTIVNRYNLWNQEPKAVEIAHKELSALCHAVGIFKLSFENVPPEQYGRELIGGRGTMKVDLQDAAKPDGYVEVKKIYDANGNEPGKGGSAPQPQGQWGGQQQAPQQQTPQNNAPAANSGGWGQPQNQQPAIQQQAPGGWQPGPSNATPQGNSQQPPWIK